MIREVKLTPTATVSDASSYVDPGTSPYPWLGTGSIKVHEIWAYNTDTTHGTAGLYPNGTPYAYFWGSTGLRPHYVSFEPGPTLALFNKVTFRTRFDCSQSGPDNWWGPPDVPHFQGIRICFRDRAKSAFGGNWHFSSYWYRTETAPANEGGKDYDININTQGGQFDLTPWLTWELTSHPEGGVWTLQDINNLVAGVDVYAANGPNGKPYDPSQGSFFKIRVPNFQVTLTVQDLGGYVRSTRHNASATLRMHRKARNTISVTVPAHEDMKGLGETLNLAHRRGPDSEGQGWGEKPLERRSVWIAQKTYWPEALKVVNEGYDLHDFSCEMWAAYRIPIPWTPELSGFAYLDQGGEWTFDRTGDGWSLRPGDGVALRVLEDYPNLSEEGLAIHTANGTTLLTSSYDAGGTGWSTTDASGGTVTYTLETNATLVDELGYQTCRLMEFPGTPGTSGKKQDFSLTAGDRFSVRVRVRNISVSDPDTKYLEAVILSPGGNYWNETNRAWEVGAHYHAIPAGAAFGEVVLDQIPDDGTGTYTIKVGRFSSSINSCSFAIALVDVVKNDVGMGMPLVTIASPITRSADTMTFDNASPFTFWHRERGMAVIEFRPFWRAELLAAATQKRLVQAVHTASATDEVRFVAGATDQIVFERYDVGNGSQTIGVNIVDANGDPLHITREHYLRVFVRWLDASGWRDRAPYEAMVGYALYNYADASFVSYHEESAVFAAPDTWVEDEVILSGLDGWIRWMEVKESPLSGPEAVWRR